MKNLLVILSIVFALPAMSKSITCSTPNDLKIVKIDEHKVTFLKSASDTNNREVASVEHVRTRSVGKSVDKMLIQGNIQFKFHIENSEKFSDVDDYVTMTSPTGHSVTYPISCQ
jgi:hypothetical protein